MRFTTSLYEHQKKAVEKLSKVKVGALYLWKALKWELEKLGQRWNL